MKRNIAIQMFFYIFVSQLHTLHALSIDTPGGILSVEEDQVKYIVPQNNTIFSTNDETASNRENGSLQLDRPKALDKLRKQIILAKRSQHRIFAHDPEDIFFILTALILLCFHLFFMDMFVRMTRPRFQTSPRFQYLSTVHLFLSFLVCVVYFLLILLHYRDAQYCG